MKPTPYTTGQRIVFSLLMSGILIIAGGLYILLGENREEKIGGSASIIVGVIGAVCAFRFWARQPLEANQNPERDETTE